MGSPNFEEGLEMLVILRETIPADRGWDYFSRETVPADRGWDYFLGGSLIYYVLLGNGPRKSSSSMRKHEKVEGPQLALWGSHV